MSPDMCKKRLGSLPFILPAPSQQTQCLQDTRDPHMLLTGTSTLDMWRALQTPANLKLVSHIKDCFVVTLHYQSPILGTFSLN